VKVSYISHIPYGRGLRPAQISWLDVKNRT
jgi:hypothetical protein